MKKGIIRIAPIIVTLFLCACSAEGKHHNEEETITPLPTVTKAAEATVTPSATATPEATPTPTEEVIAQRYINALDRIDWKELDGCVNEEDSLRNSNLLNYGFVTYDNQGKIYFTNLNDRKLYVSGYRGEDKKLICESSNDYAWLQLAGDWLYCSDTYGGILRVHLENQEIEQITEKHSGAYLIDGEKIFLEDKNRKGTGFSTMDLEGNNIEQLLDSRGYLGHFVQGDGFWLGKMSGGSDTISQKCYLVKFNEEKMEILKQKGNFPLLAGKYFSVVDNETQTRHIWNLETKQEVDLKARTEKAVVSDGHEFYYWSKSILGDNFLRDKTDAYCTISRWDGTASEEIIRIDGAVCVYHLFLTPELLYYQPDFWIDGKQTAQLWYYDRKTGETGQIY